MVMAGGDSYCVDDDLVFAGLLLSCSLDRYYGNVS